MKNTYTAAVITVSDKASRGERVDTSGPAVREILEQAGFEVVYTAVVPDEKDRIEAELIRCADEKKIALVMTTGGTGFSQRDITPEATLAVIERETRGIPEAMRWASLQITPRGCLSRSAAGIRGKTLIVNLPGSEKACWRSSIPSGTGWRCSFPRAQRITATDGRRCLPEEAAREYGSETRAARNRAARVLQQERNRVWFAVSGQNSRFLSISLLKTCTTLPLKPNWTSSPMR